MIPLTATEIRDAAGGRLAVLTSGDRGAVVVAASPTDRRGEVVIRAVTADSRSLGDADEPATLFVALRTPAGDGHAHLDDALRRGASAVVVEASSAIASTLGASDDATSSAASDGIAVSGEVPPAARGGVPAIVVDDAWVALRRIAAVVRDRIAPTAVAITGSVGKTTVKDLSAGIVGRRRRTHASPASFNNELGVPLTLLGMADGTEVVICEIGARAPGDVAALAAVVRPSVAVVTAVAPAHLGPFGSIEAIAAAKAELVESLGADGVAVLNVDNPHVAAMAGKAPSTIGVSLHDPSADVVARRVHLRRDGRAEVTIGTPWGTIESVLPLPGRHQAVNAMLAIGVAGALGVGTDDMAEGLAAATVSRWRGQVIELGGGITVVDDAYNANPASVEAALDTLAVVGAGRRTVAVLGEMAELGPSSPAAHRAVGTSCVRHGIAQVVAVGAAAAPIAAQARDDGHAAAWTVDDTAGAMRWLDEHLRPGDVVLVKASRAPALDRVVAHLCARHADDTGWSGAASNGGEDRA